MSNGIDPKIWGPAAWAFIKYVLMGFDPKSQSEAALVTWINTLPEILPCAKCRKNFTETLKKYPFKNYLKDRKCSTWYSLVRQDVAKHEPKKNHKYKRLVPIVMISLTSIIVVGFGLYLLTRRKNKKRMNKFK